MFRPDRTSFRQYFMLLEGRVVQSEQNVHYYLFTTRVANIKQENVEVGSVL